MNLMKFKMRLYSIPEEGEEEVAEVNMISQILGMLSPHFTVKISVPCADPENSVGERWVIKPFLSTYICISQ